MVRVIDADTLVVRVPGWPRPYNPVKVRLDGIDTPESFRGAARCLKELHLGLIAKTWLKERLPVGSKVTVIWSGNREKYGRLLGTILSGNVNINNKLVQLGYAAPYQGEKKPSWCGS